MFGNDVRIKRTETLTYLGIVIEIRESRRYNDKKKGACVMKPLTCEMCGGTDVVKQDGLFVCQYCGTKYSVEEARKMMIEGTVEIQGTVKVDNAEQLQNSLNNARNARAKEDWERTEKYYQIVESIDPQCYEATIYSAFSKLKQAMVDKNFLKRKVAFDVFSQTLLSFYSDCDMHDITSLLEFTKTLGRAVLKVFETPFEYNEKRNSKGYVFATDRPQTFQLFSDLATTFCQAVGRLRNRSNRADVSLYLFDFSLELYYTAMRVKQQRIYMEKGNVEKLFVTSNNLMNFERKVLFAQFPREIEGMKKRRGILLSDIKRCETDLKGFSGYAETAKLQSETNNLERFLSEKKLLPAQKTALKKQIMDSRARLAQAKSLLVGERDRCVVQMRAEVRRIDVILGNVRP